MGIEIAWSVGVEATGDRILPAEQIVELADAVAPRGGSASGIEISERVSLCGVMLELHH